ncbi:hypothetical protein [Streptomyces sp. KMM 9044]|nr:hypothetical protein [Streptomyces sp. KMM 9044]WAX79352.1 hypothetical protein HUV60_018455 [Streptomyces sp. KMM 9044]
MEDLLLDGVQLVRVGAALGPDPLVRRPWRRASSATPGAEIPEDRP